MRPMCSRQAFFDVAVSQRALVGVIRPVGERCWVLRLGRLYLRHDTGLALVVSAFASSHFAKVEDETVTIC